MSSAVCASCMLELQDEPYRCSRCGAPQLVPASMAFQLSDPKLGAEAIANTNHFHSQGGAVRMNDDQLTLLNVSQVAVILGVTKARAYTLIADGSIPVVRLRRQLRVSRAALEKFIEKGGRPLTGDRRAETAA